MKVFISCDLEGITGVVKKNQLGAYGDNYEKARKLMTLEINAATRGAFRGGASKVVVNDAHGVMDNILIEELDDEIELISGYPKLFSMMEGIWAGFDLAFFVGYHSMKDRAGVLSHTYDSRLVWEVKLNKKIMGETGINAMIAGYYETPIGLVSGDDTVILEATDILGENTNYIQTKKALSKYSAWNKPFNRVCKELENSAKIAVENVTSLTPLHPPAPVQLKVTFTDQSFAKHASLLPGAELKACEKNLSSLVIKYEAGNIIEAFKALNTMLILASSV